MTFQFRSAVRERVSLLIGLAGASGAGKTYSALQLAKGLAGANGTIAFVDTEAGRAKHYADQFSFLHADFAPPFTPERYVEAIAAAEQSGADVVVIDSMSHEWAGEGGCQDIHAEIAARMAMDRNTGEINAARLEALSAPAWREPKMRHKRMVSKLLQSHAHLIFCLRAEEKVKFRAIEEERNGRVYKKTVIEPAGWVPICEKAFMYEMTLSLTLSPDMPGMPRFDLPHKLQAQHRPVFPEGRPIGEAAGAALHAWANGGQVQPANPVTKPKRTWATVIDELRQLADAAESESEIESLRGHDIVRLVMDKGAEKVRHEAEQLLRDAAERLVPSLDEVVS